DGVMSFGPWFGAWGSLRYGALAGLLIATLSGTLVALIHAVATVTFRGDQIVSGGATNTRALGVPRFLSIVAFGEGQETQSPAVPSLPKIDLPGLGEISPVVPLTIVLGVAAWWVLKRD